MKKTGKRHETIWIGIIIALVIEFLVCTAIEIQPKRKTKTVEDREKSKAAVETICVCAGATEAFSGIKTKTAVVNKKDVSMSRSEKQIDTDGFVYYEIPEEYQEAGGCLPEDVQIYTYNLCKKEGVRYALILAMIEQESGYRCDCIGDDGKSIGYMQIMQKWHKERMDKVGVTDLMNPYQNIYIGVDYMKELIDRYGTIQDALAAYNYGEKEAEEKLWSNGEYVYSYNENIISRMKEIEEELGQ